MSYTAAGKVRQNERMKEAEGRPKGAVESSETAELSMRDSDEKTSRLNRKEFDQIFRTEAQILSML